MNRTALPHLARIADLDDRAISDLFAAADRLRSEPAAARKHSNRIVAMLFYEPSTRTRLSFESAAHRIGAQVIGFADPKVASAAKGESLIDTIRTVQRYADAIVLRHPSEGAAMLASKVAMVPIINAGDGGHEHPTQTLFDLYTLRQRLGSLRGKTIGMIGDLLFGRTVHSLAKASARFGAKLIFVAPPELQLPDHLREQLSAHTSITLVPELERVIGELDVLYVTRLQTERMDEAFRAKLRAMKPLSRSQLSGAKPNLLIMHPLPRVDELGYDVDAHPGGWYFEQLANGVVMRMAILDRLLSLATPIPLGAMDAPQTLDDPPWQKRGELPSCPNANCITNTEHSITPRSEDGDHCAYCDHPRRV